MVCELGAERLTVKPDSRSESAPVKVTSFTDTDRGDSRIVRLKLAVGEAAKAAVTLKLPAVLLAVSTEEVATPLASVMAVVCVAPLANRPLAPEGGAVNVTVTPPTGALPASSTRA